MNILEGLFRNLNIDLFILLILIMKKEKLILRKLYIKEIRIESPNGSLPFVLLRTLYSAVSSGIEVFLSV